MKEQINEIKYNKQLEVAILKNTGSTIQFLKNQQWKVCYYTLLLYAAIIAVQQLFIWNNGYIKVGLLILTSFVIVFSILLNFKLRDSTIEHRKYITTIYKNNEKQIKSYEIPINQETKDDLLNFIFVGSAAIGGGITLLIIALYK